MYMHTCVDSELSFKITDISLCKLIFSVVYLVVKAWA